MEITDTGVEKYIAGSYSEPGMLKVVRVRATPAVAPGENFLSVIWRLSIMVLLNNGDVKERNYIFKKMPDDHERRQLILDMGAFKKEIIVYQEVIKHMDKLMTEVEDMSHRPWCNFISHFNYSTLLLEDLKPLGYCPADKQGRLTLKESELVFTALARFHAVSKVALDRGMIQKSLLAPRLSCTDPKFIENFFVRLFNFTSRAIDETWGPQWKYLVAKLNQPAEIIVNKMLEVGKVDDTRFNTVVHGDMWTNNILFQRDITGEPVAVKFVDLQLSFYGTVGWDMTYLAYTSLNRSLREQHMDHLLKIYTDNLRDDLTKYGYPIEKIPTCEYVIREMKRLRFWAVVTLIVYNAIILTGVTGNKEDEEILMNFSTTTTHIPEIYKSQIFKDLVAEDLIDLINEGTLD